MGQAKARGSKEQRVAEAVERARIEAIALSVRKEAERIAMLEAAQAAKEVREKANAERLARGEKPLPQRTTRNPRLRASALIAMAGIAMAFNPRN